MRETVKNLIGWGLLLAVLLLAGVTYDSRGDEILNPTAPTLAGKCLLKNGITLSFDSNCAVATPNNPQLGSPTVTYIPSGPTLPTLADTSVYSPITNEIYVSRSGTGGVSAINLYTGTSVQIAPAIWNYTAADSMVFNSSTNWICATYQSGSNNYMYQFDPVSKTMKLTTNIVSGWGIVSNTVYDPVTHKCVYLLRDNNANRQMVEIDGGGNVTQTQVNLSIYGGRLVYDPAHQLTYILSGTNSVSATFNSATHVVTGFSDSNNAAYAGCVFDPDNINIYCVSTGNANLWTINTTTQAITSTLLGSGWATPSGGLYNALSWTPITHLLYMEDNNGAYATFVYDPLNNVQVGNVGSIVNGIANNIVANYLIRFNGTTTWEVDNITPGLGTIIPPTSTLVTTTTLYSGTLDSYFNNMSVAKQSQLGNFGSSYNLVWNANPTISSGFGTTPSFPGGNSTASFRLNIGTGGTASSGIIGFPTAASGWNVHCDVLNPTATNLLQQTVETASNTFTATLVNYTVSTGVATAWPASTILVCTAFSF